MIHQPTVQFSMLPQSILNELGIREGSGICSKCCFFSLRCIILTCICSCRNKLCSLAMNFWAHAVIFTAKSCLFLMLHHLRPGDYNYLILFFSPVPGAQRIIFYIVNDVLQNIFIIICSGPETSGMIQNSHRNPSIQHTLHILFNFSSLSFFPFPCSQTNSLWKHAWSWINCCDNCISAIIRHDHLTNHGSLLCNCISFDCYATVLFIKMKKPAVYWDCRRLQKRCIQRV